jgi:SAM-dependent methyltransferase
MRLLSSWKKRSSHTNSRASRRLTGEGGIDHKDHVSLLREGVPSKGGVWADFGSGAGAFTLALADLIGAGGKIYAIDRDAAALRVLERDMRERFPGVATEVYRADFIRPLATTLPPLDGIVMANALHFVPGPRQESVLRLLRGYLRPGGGGNPWVPYPLSYPVYEKLAGQSGFTSTRKLAGIPSRFLGEIYSALSLNP